MPKLKTHKGLAKRVKITGSGKVKRHRCNHGHLLSGKSSKERRISGGQEIVKGVLAKKIRILLNK
ncbi:MAG TPA: 50S ribosomal protein L35 [Anaerohalosphaeraceae bacterium]|nr:50S ribosomal protein L35 [Phycisphaerae bacterium]HOK95916.1 50S ribosomal protein L35 [Anaerohalosphaeraceae bacterium]HOL30529.1 50S ribosomal protein L35 [Anaerohalosphaeraceae bacterium]HOM75220.1 50S ribosomal protein L35 [Anaerohalosphaeraceae bacterium]HPC63987.1 50S ribosomal protein L35 [Anaerohalosphaeraceae bacterium]